jgi:hypothetical protein
MHVLHVIVAYVILQARLLVGVFGGIGGRLPHHIFNHRRPHDNIASHATFLRLFLCQT